MLIYQALKSQEIWNGIEITKDLYDDIFLSLQTILERKQRQKNETVDIKLSQFKQARCA